MCDIIFDQPAHRVCHVSMLNESMFIDIKPKHLQIFLGFGYFRKSSENVRKYSYDLRTTF